MGYLLCTMLGLYVNIETIGFFVNYAHDMDRMITRIMGANLCVCYQIPLGIIKAVCCVLALQSWGSCSFGVFPAFPNGSIDGKVLTGALLKLPYHYWPGCF